MRQILHLKTGKNFKNSIEGMFPSPFQMVVPSSVLLRVRISI